MTPLWKNDAPAGTPFVPDAHHDVLIVGAGITGLSTALMLARAGRDVVVLEAGEVANLATGSNTGKVSLLQGAVLSTLRAHHPAALVQAYVDMNRAGAEWIRAFADDAGVAFSRRVAYSYAQTASGVDAVAAELSAAHEAGLDVRRVYPDDSSVPFPMIDAVALDDQAALDPAVLAGALARAFLGAGGTLHTGVRVDKVRAVPHAGVQTSAGSMTADQVVLATATPITDRGLYFAKTHAMRSYCVAFDVAGGLPDGMYLSVDDPSRSIRSVTEGDGPASTARLIVGGNGHPVGRVSSEQALVDDLITWTQRHFDGAQPVRSWSAQDYESHNLVPFVGVMPRSLGRVRFATGYGKWGLSNGPAAALRLTAEILKTPSNDRPRWMTLIGHRLTVPADVGRGAAENIRVGWQAASGWAGSQRQSVPVTRPAEGQGAVAHQGLRPVGVSTVEGTTRAVSAICPHLGGVLAWNDAECTWDCPLHASRFSPDGTRIEGPATSDLDRLSQSAAGA